MTNNSQSNPSFTSRPHNKELFYFLKALGWKMNLHPRAGERFIHNGVYDRSARANDGLYLGKDGKYYYCGFQEYLKDDGQLDFFQFSIMRKSKSVRDSQPVTNGLLSTGEMPTIPPGWEVNPDSDYQYKVTSVDLRDKIDEIKSLLSSL
jgi:hypothetical protein